MTSIPNTSHYPWYACLDVRVLTLNGEMNKETPTNLSPSDLQEWLESDSLNPVLIDVREDTELDIAPFPLPVDHLPLSRFSEWSNTLLPKLAGSNGVVVLCHSGIRSWDFSIWLLGQGLGIEVWNLDGGIDAWSQKVDATVPRY